MPAMWTTPEEVQDELGPGPFTTPADLEHLGRCVRVAHRQVVRWRPELDVSCSDPDVRLGAAKLAALHFRRRGGTGGEFAEFSELAAYNNGVSFAEIQTLLAVGQHHGPVVA